MRISDWSSDVCSSDLLGNPPKPAIVRGFVLASVVPSGGSHFHHLTERFHGAAAHLVHHQTRRRRSEEHTSELQSLMRISYAVFCLKKKNKKQTKHSNKT